MSKDTKTFVSPRERLIETALKLFYTQGYQATGINQLIKEAGVAKASFYDNFADKEELCVAFLERRHELWMNSLEKAVENEKNTKKRISAVFGYLKDWMRRDKYRGCAFLNMASEFCDGSGKVRKLIAWHKNALSEYLGVLIKEHYGAKSVSAKRLKQLERQIYVLVEGAIVSSQVHESPWPIEEARGAAQILLD